MKNSSVNNVDAAVSPHPAIIRLVALDLDGTLLNAHFQISERNLLAVKRISERGIRILLMTGRRFKMAEPFARQLQLTTPLVVHNGALTKHLDSSDHLFHCPLPLPKARQIIEFGRQHQMDPVVFLSAPDGSRMLVESVHPDNVPLQKYIQLSVEDVQFMGDLQSSLREDPIQVMFSGRVSQVRKLSDALHSQMNGQTQLLHTEYRSRDFAFLDVLEHGTSKGAALKRLAELWEIAPSGILAMGDNANDLEMLRYAGKAVLMGNAEQDLLEPAFERTASNEEDGVALALEKYCGI